MRVEITDITPETFRDRTNPHLESNLLMNVLNVVSSFEQLIPEYIQDAEIRNKIFAKILIENDKWKLEIYTHYSGAHEDLLRVRSDQDFSKEAIKKTLDDREVSRACCELSNNIDYILRKLRKEGNVESLQAALEDVKKHAEVSEKGEN